MPFSDLDARRLHLDDESGEQDKQDVVDSILRASEAQHQKTRSFLTEQMRAAEEARKRVETNQRIAAVHRRKEQQAQRLWAEQQVPDLLSYYQGRENPEAGEFVRSFCQEQVEGESAQGALIREMREKERKLQQERLWEETNRTEQGLSERLLLLSSRGVERPVGK